MKETPSYEEVCRYVGQLFLESRHNLERIAREADQRVAQAESERDQALRLLQDTRQKE